MSPPDKILIPHDDHRFPTLGRLPDGSQWMAFELMAFPGKTHIYSRPDWPDVKRLIAVLHQFDTEGNHLATTARLVGVVSDGRAAEEKLDSTFAALLSEFDLENAPCSPIEIKPFSVEIDEIVYELVYEQEEIGGEVYEQAILWPINVAFYPPWNDGRYDT